MITKTIMIDGKEVAFKASAAIPRLYRIKFRRDIIRDFAQLQKAMDRKKEDQDDLEIVDLEVFENIAYIMAKHARPDEVPETPEDWLEGYNTFSIYEVIPALQELWYWNMETQSEAKKNLTVVSGS